MATLKQETGRALALLLAGAALASCTAHGLGKGPDPRVYVNYTPYSASFYENLLSDKVWIFRNPARRTYRDVPHFMIFRSDGQRLRCTGRWITRYKLDWMGDELARWSVQGKGTGAVVRYDYEKRKPTYVHFFYDPASGTLAVDLLKSDVDRRRTWTRGATGWVQNSLPRSLTDACPGLDLPAGMQINEKQTSQKLDELRRQDPDAPIRNFPGSHLRAPGTTGLGASRGAPTTTAEEVDAYLAAQEGNILKSPAGNGFVYARTEAIGEFWAVGEDGAEEEFVLPVRSQDGDKITARIGGRDVVYMVGYPFPFRPTGHRHAAFQLTDEFLARPYPRELPFMGEAYANKRFVFHPKGKFSVVDEAGNLVEGPHFAGTWAWTKGNLEMTVRNDPPGPKRVHWRILAAELGMKPVMWTKHTPDKID